jgi:hypothetical protein
MAEDAGDDVGAGGEDLGVLFDAACAAPEPLHAFANTAFVCHALGEEEIAPGMSAVQVAICHREDAGAPWVMEEEFSEEVRQALHDAGFRAEAENCMAIMGKSENAVRGLLVSWGMVAVTMDELEG